MPGRSDTVEKRGAKYVVLSEAGKVLGEFETQAQANERLRQIEAAKARGDARVEVWRYDRAKLGKARIDKETGFLRAPASVTRAGIFLYRDGRGNTRRELRHPDDVGDADSLETLRNVVVTNRHPPEGHIDSRNAKKHGVGHGGDRVEFASDRHVNTDLVFTDQDTIDEIVSGQAQEASGGYKTVVLDEAGTWEGQHYDARQTRIRYNHVAVVPRGRAGSSVRIHLDAADAAQLEDSGARPMADGNAPAPAPTARLDVDGVTLELTEVAALHVKKVIDAAAELKTNLDKERARADAAEKALKETKEKLDEAKKGLDAEAVQKRVDARLKLFADIATIVKMDEEATAHVKTLDDEGVRKFIVKHACDEVDVEKESADYIRARFDHLVSAQPKVDSTTSAAAAIHALSHARKEDDDDALQKKVDEAYAAMDGKAKNLTGAVEGDAAAQ